MKYSIILAVFSFSALAGAYLWGYSCGKQEQGRVAKAELFDRLIGDLANSILIDDAIEVGREGEVRPVGPALNQILPAWCTCTESMGSRAPQILDVQCLGDLEHLKNKGVFWSTKVRVQSTPSGPSHPP